MKRKLSKLAMCLLACILVTSCSNPPSPIIVPDNDVTKPTISATFYSPGNQWLYLYQPDNPPFANQLFKTCDQGAVKVRVKVRDPEGVKKVIVSLPCDTYINTFDSDVVFTNHGNYCTVEKIGDINNALPYLELEFNYFMRTRSGSPTGPGTIEGCTLGYPAVYWSNSFHINGSNFSDLYALNSNVDYDDEIFTRYEGVAIP